MIHHGVTEDTEKRIQRKREFSIVFSLPLRALRDFVGIS
jgi:hypothetical protein